MLFLLRANFKDKVFLSLLMQIYRIFCHCVTCRGGY